MLQSNTDARSFKLQPAPRPKCKKRPQSCTSPPTPAAASTAFPVVDTSSDTRSLRSCFDDDDAPTPRASQFVSPLSARSSMSAASAASGGSTRSSTSVGRLLASLSVSPRVKTTSPVATVPVMLSSKSPTPSSPLFPRRTLMRSLSSTCMNAHLKSPTSPMTPSVDAKMRKRMGWRGAISARVHAETAILMSPGSPITPRRAEALHTPTQADTTQDEGAEIEPLSATLKRIGAKRRTERFASPCVPIQSPLQEEYRSPDTARSESWQVMTATRKIFQLPSWVRFEANHHARNRAAVDNRTAATEYSKLQLERSTAQHFDGALLPKVSHVGDVAPDSPNGELFAGFDVDLAAEKKTEPEWVVSVIRPPNMAALRTERVEAKSSRVLGVVRSALPGLAPQRRIKGYTAKEGERDGWGGLTRSSWFPNHAKGPLVSPNPPDKQRGLKKIILQPAGKEDEWEDIDEPASAKPATSFLEMNDAPRFQPRIAARRWFGLRSSSPEAKEGKDWMGEIQLDTWRTRRLSVDKVVASELVTKHDSVENRPVRNCSARTAWIVAALTAVIVVAIVANVVAAKNKPVQLGTGGGGVVVDGLGMPSAVQPVLDPRQSSVAKAAQMSHA